MARARGLSLLALVAVLTPSLLAVETRTNEWWRLQTEIKTVEKRGLFDSIGDLFVEGIKGVANDMDVATAKTGSLIGKGISSVAHDIGAATAETARGVENLAAIAGKAIGDVRFTVSQSSDRVCYKELGCFSLKHPWNRALVPEPQSPEKINTRFYLYTRKSPLRFNVTTHHEVDLRGANFHPENPTFFITHGYINTGNYSWMRDMKDAILKKVDSNVFLVDWGAGAYDINYYQIAGNTRIVGAELAGILKHLILLGTPPYNVHLIGHSLGAHISAYAAKETPGIGRITALDPAQPAFEGYDARVRLDPSDAEFVDVIHSNAKPFVPLLGFGMMMPVGHVDFYMNGGADQPGCEVPVPEAIKALGDILTQPVKGLWNLAACSHERAHEYFTEAIESDCKMWGHPDNLAKQLANWASGGNLGIITTKGKCKPGECIPLGLDTPMYPARGAFMVGTSPARPFCEKDLTNDGQDLDELRSLGLTDPR